ncbi:MAG: YfhO family protein [Chloroflexi bacterium]|nr:YfhO family protein [Chloroflexota bacterium]MCL5075897.1 YfhO family protein [Chloroflexota bacterium]
MVRLRRYWPDLRSLALLLVLILVFYRQTALSPRILIGYDIFTYFYPNEAYAAERLHSGQLPLWNPYLFTGVPFLANIQTGIFYPLNLLFLLFFVPRAYVYSVVLHVFLAGCFMYLFARVSLHLQRWAAFLAAVVLMFGGFTSSLVGHLNQLQAATWLPLLFLLTDLTYRERRPLLALATGAVLALQLLAGHMQESYLTLCALSGLVLFYGGKALWGGYHPSHSEENSGEHPQSAAREGVLPLGEHLRGKESRTDRWRTALGSVISKEISGLALVGVSLLLGFGLAAVQLWPTYELANLSIRAGGLTYKEAVSFSLPPWLILKSLLPPVFDAPIFSEYWGYVGVCGLILAALAVVMRPRDKHVLFFALLALLSLFLALGQFNPLYPYLYKILPGLALFRVPARWLFLYTFAMAALAGIALHILLEGTPSARLGWPGRAHPAVRVILRLAILGALALLPILAYVALRLPYPLETPSAPTAIVWLVSGASALLLIIWALSTPASRLAIGALVCLLYGELLLSSQNLDLNRPNLPEAYSSLRPAVAHLLADPGIYRVLPLSDNTFDPGDLREQRGMLNAVLSPQAVYDYIVALKQKETLMPNLPLRYHIASIDGYDGGVLPLERYVAFKRLFPLSRKDAPDARLREQLETIPDPSLLGWLNVKYILMDRLRDVWADGVYYDLALRRTVGPAGTRDLTLEHLPDFETTSIGLVSYLSGASGLPDGTTVATISVTDSDGKVYTAPLQAGVQTAEGRYNATVGHRPARRVMAPTNDPQVWDYQSQIPLLKPIFPKRLTISSVAATADLHLRGISLIDDRTGASRPVVLDNFLRIVHLGDVKIYRNLAALPRAFLVPEVELVSNDAAALDWLRRPTFRPREQAVIVQDDWPGGDQNLSGAGTDQATVDILEYSPERIVLHMRSAHAGVLVLTDSYYPGWRAWVDGHEQRIMRVDYLFRGLVLKDGEHTVEFRYEPRPLLIGLLLSLCTLALALIWVIISIVLPKAAPFRRL